jgi:WD40 repeat protein
VIAGHAGPVTSVAFSPDGRLLASAGCETAELGPAEVKVWEADSGRERVRLSGRFWRVGSLAFHPNGQRLVTASGSPLPKAKGGVVIAVGEGGEIKLWDVTTGRQVGAVSGPTSGVASVAFSPDGHYIASADVDGGVWLAETATGRKALHLSGHNSFVTGVAFSPDGRRLASSGADNAVRMWNIPTGEELFTIRAAGPLVGVAFSTDGQQLASASESPRHAVTIWHARGGAEEDMVAGPFNEAGFASDGRLLGYADAKNSGMVAVTDVATGKELFSYAESADLHPTHVSRGNGRIAVLVDDGSPQRFVDPQGQLHAPAWRNIRV